MKYQNRVLDKYISVISQPRPVKIASGAATAAGQDPAARRLTCDDAKGTWKDKWYGETMFSYLKASGENGHDETDNYNGGTCVENPDGTVTLKLERHVDNIESTTTMTLTSSDTAQGDAAFHYVRYIGGRNRYIGTLYK